MRFLIPQGIGDAVWALHKIQSAAKKLGAEDIDVFLNYAPPYNDVQARGLDFVKRFDFVKSASMMNIAIHNYDNCIDPEGRYIYIPDGWTEPLWATDDSQKVYALMPNGHLERGVRLENWMPEFDINWDTSDHFKFEESDLHYAETIKHSVGEYCVFYLGPYRGNMFEGHNRGCLWTPYDWYEVGEWIERNMGLSIVVVGAHYDMEYWQNLMAPVLWEKAKGRHGWENLIGETSIAKTFAICKRAKFVISYQSGIGIFSSYMKVPTAIFWRAKGDSISPNVYLSFEEEMANDWVRPDMLAARKHLPLIYGRHSAKYVMNELNERGWK